ncbi:MAG: metallophosphoesterase [Lentisphaeria bacterium]|nr:metallophosphoesterase [Lentisphaeria bacterium]
MKRYIVTTLLSSILLCSGCICREKPNLRIAVTSDAQAAASANHWGIVNTDKAFRFLAPFKPDVLIMPGDLAERFQPEVYDLYMASFLRNFKAKLPTQVACAGNHDFWSRKNEDADTIWNEFTTRLKISRENPCRQLIGGYDFITLSQKEIGEVPEDLLAQLKIKLDEAVSRDSKKPVFLVTHYPPSDTMYRSSGRYGQKNLRELLNKYPQVISLSGHTHIPLNWERAFWQGEFTALTCSTLSYGCIGGGKFFNVAGGSILPFAREVQQAMIIDIFDNKVKIHRYNIHDRKEIKSDSLWIVDIPYKSKAAAEIEKDLYARALAPEFPQDAKLLIRNDFGFAYLLFPAAVHPQMVLGYVVKVQEKSSDGSWKTLNESEYVADFYRYEKHRTSEVSVKLPENIFTVGRKLKFEVFPVEDFGKRGKSLTLEFTSPWKLTRSARQEYPVE